MRVGDSTVHTDWGLESAITPTTLNDLLKTTLNNTKRPTKTTLNYNKRHALSTLVLVGYFEENSLWQLKTTF